MLGGRWWGSCVLAVCFGILDGRRCCVNHASVELVEPMGHPRGEGLSASAAMGREREGLGHARMGDLGVSPLSL